jgi:hypothetical protein
MHAAPPADIRSAAARFAPPGAHVFLALERDATTGVIAWTRDGRPQALALRWSDGRWRAAKSRGLSLKAGPGVVHEPFLLRVRGASVVWIDGREAAITGYEYVLLIGQRRGAHTVVALAQRGAGAVARAWSYTVR